MKITLKSILIAIIAKNKNACSLLNKHWPAPSDRRQAIKDMESSFYEMPEDEEVIPGYAHKPWDRKQFFSDYPVFVDADLDMMFTDNFTQMSTGAWDQKLTYLARTRAYFTAFLKKSPEKVGSIMGMYPHILKWAKDVTREEFDDKYDWLMKKKLEAATPSMYSKDLGQSGSMAAKFHEGEHAQSQKASYGQLTRMIWEDCKMASGEVKIPQLTQPGACSVPSHLRIEQMQKYMGLDLNQAAVLAKIYRIMNLGYAQVAIQKVGRGVNRKTLNNHIKDFVKQGKGQPWDIIVAPGKSLLMVAQQMKALALEEQEDPDWAKADHFIPGNAGATYTKAELNDYVTDYVSSVDEDGYELSTDETTNVWMSMHGEHYSIVRDDEDRERQFDQTNPVGMYTYNNISQIPRAAHLAGGKVKLFIKALAKLQGGDLTMRARAVASKWVQKNGTFAQKTEWRRSLRAVA